MPKPFALYSKCIKIRDASPGFALFVLDCIFSKHLRLQNRSPRPRVRHRLMAEVSRADPGSPGLQHNGMQWRHTFAKLRNVEHKSEGNISVTNLDRIKNIASMLSLPLTLLLSNTKFYHDCHCHILSSLQPYPVHIRTRLQKPHAYVMPHFDLSKEASVYDEKLQGT